MLKSMYRSSEKSMMKIEIPPSCTCAFTGHRPHKLPWRYDETDSRCLALKAVLTQNIIALAQTGITDFFSGMAEGTDSYCAQIILDLREKNPALKLHCVLPCPNQESKWSNSAQECYHSILRRADSVVYVSQKYYQGCMLERNRRLVDSAAVLLAVYNGERRGGTAATMRYAKKLGRQVIILHPSASLSDL